MTDPTRWTGQMPSTRQQQQPAGDGTNLADILERVLDKGIVIAGDVQINLLDIELLTIKLRLVVASVDRAKEMGIDWWERDPTLSAGHRELEDENKRLRERVEALESGARTLAGTNGTGHGVDDRQHGEDDEDGPDDPEDDEEAQLDEPEDDADVDDAEIGDADIDEPEDEDAEFEDEGEPDDDAELEDAELDEADPEGEPIDDEPEGEPVAEPQKAPRRRTSAGTRPRKRRS
jgi:hypothetical protein